MLFLISENLACFILFYYIAGKGSHNRLYKRRRHNQLWTSQDSRIVASPRNFEWKSEHISPTIFFFYKILSKHRNPYNSTLFISSLASFMRTKHILRIYVRSHWTFSMKHYWSFERKKKKLKLKFMHLRISQFLLEKSKWHRKPPVFTIHADQC